MVNNRIKVFRAINEMTQEQLANATGISRPNISNIEKNKQEPSGATMIKIAKALHATVEEIFFGDNVLPVIQNENTNVSKGKEAI